MGHKNGGCGCKECKMKPKRKRGRPKGRKNKKPTKKTKKTRCWIGYEPVKGRKAYSKGSCRKIKK